MFEAVKEAVRVLKKHEPLPIELSEVKELVEKYFLQELKKGEHADEIDFDFMDMCGEILDYFSTDEDIGKFWLLKDEEKQKIWGEYIDPQKANENFDAKRVTYTEDPI